MKAIILLIAVLACVSASKLNFKEFYVGFTEELEFTKEQHVELKECATEVAATAHKYLAPGKSAITAKLMSLLFADEAKHREVILAVHQYLQTALPACRKFAVSFASIFTEAGVSEVERHVYGGRRVQLRMHRHMDIIVSNIIAAYDAIHAQDSKSAGESIAYILEILTGVEHPETIQEFIKEYEQPVEIQVMDKDAFLQKTIQEVFITTGHTEKVELHRVKALREAIEALVHIQIGVQIQLHKVHSGLERQIVMIGAVRDMIKAGAVAAENVKLIMTPYLQHAKFHHYNGRQLVAHFIHNYYLHLPYLQQHTVDAVMGIKAHHPVQTGHAIGRLVNIMTHGSADAENEN